MQGLETEQGKITEQGEILKEVKNVYESLYKKQTPGTETDYNPPISPKKDNRTRKTKTRDAYNQG